MAQAVFLFLNSNSNKIDGDSTVTSDGRENSIECVSFTAGVKAHAEKATKVSTGVSSVETIEISKRLDRSSPLLVQSVLQQEVIDAEFKMYRPAPDGTGKQEQYFTIKGEKGRVRSVRMQVPNCIDPASSDLPALEIVTLEFHTMIWTYVPSGIEAQYDWSQQNM